MIHSALYIHGFAGSIHSNTLGMLHRYYPDVTWHAIEVDHHAQQSVDAIQAYLAAHPDIELLIGSSLGGFYVLCTKFAGRKLVINPVLHPMASLKPFVGVNKYRGRRDNGDTEFRLTMADLFAFGRLKPADTPLTTCHYTEHDQVLGEMPKREYPSFFHDSEMCRDLRNHFADEHYIHTKLATILTSSN